MKQQLYPCLWFNGNARQAAETYCSVFKNATLTADQGMVVLFEIDGKQVMGLNGGPMFKPNASISLFIVCETMEELENAWHTLVDGGNVLMPLDKYEWSEKYGWLEDKYGVSWQLSFGKIAETGQKLTPSLLFAGKQAGQAENAINFYTSVFKDSSITGILKYNENDNDVEGTVKHAQFNLGQHGFMVMDSSMPSPFEFTEGASIVINCDTQEEIDYYWNTLTQGGAESQCGWLKDKFGISWQVVPSILGSLMQDKSKSERVMQAFLKMKKFYIETLMQA